MARKPIVIYTHINDLGDTEVIDGELLINNGVDVSALGDFGQTLKRYTITLKDRFTQALQDVVNNGCLDDPAARPRLMFTQYVQGHDLPEADFSQNEPVVCALISGILERRVFASLTGNTDFLASVRGAQGVRSNSSPAAISPPSILAGTNSIPA